MDVGHAYAYDAVFRGRPSPRKLSPLSTLMGGLVFSAAFLFPLVSAEDPISFHPPSTVTLCEPVTLNWTGGTPPYRLDVEPLVGNMQVTSQNERHINITNLVFTWTPDFPANTTLQLDVVGSGLTGSAGGHSIVLQSSNSSCLSAASPTTSQATTTSQTATSSNIESTLSPMTASSQAIVPPTSTEVQSSGGGLSKGAIAGIAVAVSLIGIGLIVGAIWTVLRRRSLMQQPGKDYDRNIVSPAFSDGASSVPYTGISSTLISADPDKPYNFVAPSQSMFGGGSNRGEQDLRPTPYLVPRESTTSLSEIRRAQKHMRELSNSSTNASTADVRAMSVSPTQFGSDEAPEAVASSVLRDGGTGGGVMVFGADGSVRFSGGSERIGSLGETEVSDVRSESGETTLPPPYAHYSIN
ncbi:hypothetical protein BD310DRAFT_880522 [Dichomitus squalens]|uniref:Mid2 domain-containing protein n=1 Tax=Dichomitus squalens TaxID=114155 RepID=A0A4Q9PT01_9APHY|nr:hypothetical protein BD310DRAFT_880522 [Dichomitus squalens]